MKKIVIFNLFLISIFIIGVCFAEGPKEKTENPVSINVEFYSDSNSNSNSNDIGGQTSRIFAGAEYDIVRMQISVFDDNVTYIDAHDMIQFEGGWTAKLTNLPIGFQLTFKVNAYNSETVLPDNMIFSGSTTQALSGVDDQVTVHLNPVADGTGIDLPVIYKIARSADTAVSSDSRVTVHIGGNPGESIDWQIISDGTFDAASGTVVIGEKGLGEFSSIYTAPNETGTYTHKVNLINSAGNSVTASFDTPVVEEPGPVVIVPIHPPIITKLNVELSGSDLIWTAVHDDTATEALTYSWSYDGGLSFEDTAANPAVMKDYDPTSSGTLTLSVSNLSGGNTQITAQITENLFPNDILNDTVQKPLGFIVAPGSGKNTLSWAPVTGATSYNIYFETAPGVTYKFHPDFTTTDTTYDHTGLSVQTYYYRVSAVGEWGEGQLSVEKSGTPTVEPQTEGRDGHALDFDGSDDYTTHGSPDLSISNNATVSAWIHPTQDNGVIVMQGFNLDGHENGWVLAIGEDGRKSSKTASGEIVWASHDASTNANNGMLINSPTKITLNQWQHVAATKNGTEVKLYLNGKLVHSESLEAAAIAYNNGFELSIGKQAQGRPFFKSAFQGKIDEMQIWNVTLSDAEIQEYMNTCLAGNEPGLVGYYKFNDGPGVTTLTDITANANHGTLTNMDENTDWVLDPEGVCGVFGTASV